jgi:peptidoglycan/xylan/chitin deacetylase (PgdA/CDA1 family)
MADVLVLCYHAVSPTWSAALSVTPDALERQLTTLVRRGWRSASFHDAVLEPLDGPTMAVTFDDAFKSVVELAHPILGSLGVIGTVFCPSAYISAGRPLAWDGTAHWAETAHAAELTPMSWSDLAALADGGWEIASHTLTHPRLTQLDDASARAELADSRAEIAANVGRPCATVAYPYGDVDDRIAALASEAGYDAGAGLSRSLRPLGRLRWPRVGIYNHDDGWRFRLKINGLTRRLRASGAFTR